MTLASASTALNRAERILRARPVLAAGTATAVAFAGLLLPAAVRSYRGFLALGPGGLPYNIAGWAMQGLAQLVACDTLDASPFQNPTAAVLAQHGPHGQASYLGTLPAGRSGDRPAVPGYAAPQRQTSDQAPAGTRAAQEAFLVALAAANPSLLDIRPSHLEGKGTAALYAVPASPGAGPAEEICHAHSEGSAHMHLSLADAAAAMRLGWAARHPLAGAPLVGLPLSYLFVYAPRDAGELRVWKQFVVAAARHAGAGRVEVVVPDA